MMNNLHYRSKGLVSTPLTSPTTYMSKFGNGNEGSDSIMLLCDMNSPWTSIIKTMSALTFHCIIVQCNYISGPFLQA